MNICNLLLSESSCQLFNLLSLLFLLLVLFQGLLIFEINVFILEAAANLLLHSILFLYHLSLKRNV